MLNLFGRAVLSARIPFCLVLLAGAAACASAKRQQVHHAADPQLRIESLARYAIGEHAVGSAEADEAITALIHQEMKIRGFQHVPDDPTVVVSFKVLTIDAAEPGAASRQTMVPGGGGLAAGDADIGLSTDAPDAGPQVDKLVLIQIIDAKKTQILWVGWGQARVAENRLATAASRMAARILRRLPNRS